ncbi:MAG: flagellar assembly protein FlaA [Leptospira sp.]|nr:flagellar assembly protein FlaA [Leptospira sp.]
MVRFVFFSLLGAFACFSVFAQASQDEWKKVIFKTYTILDFETILMSKDNWRVRKYKDDPLPEVYLSQNITAPIPGSRKALLFRFTELTNYPLEFIFSEPVEFQETIQEMEFPIYSSKSSGTLSIIMQTYDYKNVKIFLTNLNYRGWQNKKVNLSRKMNQSDPVLNSKLPLRFIGFVYEPNNVSDSISEILVGIDDITATTRKKYRTLPDPASLLE